MSLQEQIDSLRGVIRTDEYSISIGEWTSLYEREEIDIHPEFQRFFRWSSEQKTKFIESLLLGIPIPPIFVSQRPDGVWDVVDGLQRLSTLFEFVGILKKEDGTMYTPLVLEESKLLTELKGKQWSLDDDTGYTRSFTPEQRLFIRRAKIGVSIILRESSVMTKYELFMRLNTGGSALSDQEVRNCVLVSINKDMYTWMRELSLNEEFKECLDLTDRALNEQYDVELVLRFLIFRTLPEPELRDVGDLNEFLNDRMIAFANSGVVGQFDFHAEESAFKRTFRLLSQATKDDSFRKYDSSKQKFTGGFLVSAFEVVALGVGYNCDNLTEASVEKIADTVKKLWDLEEFKRSSGLNPRSSGSGVRASTRIPRIIPLGRRLFNL